MKRREATRNSISNENQKNPRQTVLVGAYKGEQLTEWRGWYNYPISDEDKIGAEDAAKITELWLFKGTKDERRYKAEFVGIKTRQELIDDYGYPAKGKAHGEKYLLFRTEFKYRHKIGIPEDAERVIIRTADFATAPKVRKQLKAYLESPDRKDPKLAKRLPEIITRLKPEQLRVCEAMVQLDLFATTYVQRLVTMNNSPFKVASLFSGCGGLDLGFERAGFNIVWANEFDKDIWETYERNHAKTYLCRKSICEVDSSEVPDCIGIIGGPPCQSWSEGGAQRGINDKRGQLFYDYIRILKAKKPLFFLAENVSGMLQERHSKALTEFKKMFVEAGYNLSFNFVNAWDYGVPQDRERVLFVGYRKDLGKNFVMPEPIPLVERKNLRDAIGDLAEIKPVGRKNGLETLEAKPPIPNHEYMTGGFSSIFLSRNRVRSWDEPSFTIQAGGRQSPLHPQAPKMERIDAGHFTFPRGKAHLYRRLSVRESARIQTFPDSFIWYYRNIAHGYKMIGNAVPVTLAEAVARQIMADVREYLHKEGKICQDK